jgi:hypothetical protein
MTELINSGTAQERAKKAVEAVNNGGVVTLKNTAGVDGGLHKHKAPYNIETKEKTRIVSENDSIGKVITDNTMVFID